MRFSPIRNFFGVTIVTLLVVLAPYLAADLALSPTALPLPGGVEIDLMARKSPDVFFLSLLGMSSIWSGVLNPQEELRGTFQSLPADWAFFSLSLFVATGIIAALMLRTDNERILTCAIGGFFAGLIGIAFFNSYLGSVEIESITKAQLMNAGVLLAGASYLTGIVVSSVTALSIGRLISRAPAPLPRPAQVVPESIEQKEAKPEKIVAEEEKPEKAVVEEKPEVKEEVEVKAEEVEKPAQPEVVEETKPAPPKGFVSEIIVKAMPELEKKAQELPKPAEAVPELPESLLQKMEAAPPAAGVATEEAPKVEEPPEAAPMELLPFPYEVRAIGEEAKAQEVIASEMSAESTPSRRRIVGEAITNWERPFTSWSKKVRGSMGLLRQPVGCPMCGSRLVWSDELERFMCPYCNTVP